ncbi:lysine-rich arabinogalactan protein 19-like [Zingiber officinale]|uniref:lysine-rich arabinogalactan protein 19-like n=1 Tax=Zingiber officinale TaxID=94328 RepID=UPI001C4AFB24|nr:lysine-rich arabinogalactan protein 19-like [Zingiber officinale]
MKEIITQKETGPLVMADGIGITVLASRQPRKRALESLVTESPEGSSGIEPVGQGQTPHGTVGASGSQIPTVPSPEVLTLTITVGTTPTVFTVLPAVALATYPAPPPAMLAVAYPTPPSAVPTAYLALPPPMPATAYPAPAPVVLAVPVAPYAVPLPTVPPVAPTYIDPAVPPVVPAPTYAATLGVLSPAYPAVLLVVPTPVVLPVPTVIPTHPTDMVMTRAQIPTLIESVKS